MKLYTKRYSKLCVLSLVFLSTLSLDILAGPKSVPVQLEMVRALLDEMDARQQAMEATQASMDARQQAMEATQGSMDARQQAMEATQNSMDTRQQAMEATQANMDSLQKAMNAQQNAHNSVMVANFENSVDAQERIFNGLEFIYSSQDTTAGVVSAEICVGSLLELNNHLGVEIGVGVGWPNVLDLKAGFKDEAGLALAAGLDITHCFNVPYASFKASNITLATLVDGQQSANSAQALSTKSMASYSQKSGNSNLPKLLIPSSTAGMTNAAGMTNTIVDTAVLTNLAGSLISGATGIFDDVAGISSYLLPSTSQVVAGFNRVSNAPEDMFKMDLYTELAAPVVLDATANIKPLVTKMVEEPCDSISGMPIISAMDSGAYDWICVIDPAAAPKALSTIQKALDDIADAIDNLLGGGGSGEWYDPRGWF